MNLFDRLLYRRLCNEQPADGGAAPAASEPAASTGDNPAPAGDPAKPEGDKPQPGTESDKPQDDKPTDGDKPKEEKPGEPGKKAVSVVLPKCSMANKRGNNHGC